MTGVQTCALPISLGRQMLTKVRIYRGAEHKHEAQKPEVLVLK